MQVNGPLPPRGLELTKTPPPTTPPPISQTLHQTMALLGNLVNLLSDAIQIYNTTVNNITANLIDPLNAQIQTFDIPPDASGGTLQELQNESQQQQNELQQYSNQQSEASNMLQNLSSSLNTAMQMLGQLATWYQLP